MFKLQQWKPILTAKLLKQVYRYHSPRRVIVVFPGHTHLLYYVVFIAQVSYTVHSRWLYI